jgi:hypothetical protein
MVEGSEGGPDDRSLSRTCTGLWFRGFLVCWLFVRSTIEKIEALFERCKIAEEPDDPRLAALLDRYKDVEWTALREELRAGDPH